MRICIPIRESNLQKAAKQVRRAAKATAGIPEVLFEIWLDSLGEDDLAELIKTCRKPVIAVCRGRIENGSFKGSEKKRVEKLERAIQAGAQFVDTGIHTKHFLIKKLQKVCRKKHATLIISQHFWKSTPSLQILINIYKRAKKLGADIVKIAINVKNWSDNVTLFELTKRIAENGEKVIVIGMGEKGKISRIGCPLLGSYLTYAALDEKSKTASGQLIIREAKNLRW